MKLVTGVFALAWFCLPAAMYAQGAPSGTGNYSGPNVLSRWSRMPGSQGGHGPTARFYLTGAYSYMDGLSGPITNFNVIPNNPQVPAGSGQIPSAGVNTAFGGGGLVVTRTDSRSSLSLGYQGAYSKAFGARTTSYQGLNQDLNLNYERRLTRRWGFYTGHTAGTQSSILGLVRQTEQRNFFDQSYTAANEALDARLNYLNSGGGLFYQMNRRVTFSMDGGVFAVSRRSQALVSSRGERAQGEVAYRISQSQSIGAVYSFSHFFFPRGFGETYTQSVMLALTRTFAKRWMAQLAIGPYRSESERLGVVAVDPYITAITGQSSTLSVFQGVNRGIGGSATVSTRLSRYSSVSASYRRGVDPGNGVTLSSVNDYGQTTWSYGGRAWSLGASAFGSRLKPLLQGAENRANFQSYGGAVNFSYRLSGAVHMISTVGVQSIKYDLIDLTQIRRTVSVGLGFSPGEFALSR
jgi:hypothetical protein